MLLAKKKILVIDDEELLIRTMSRLLEKIGYEVYCVKSGMDAEALVLEQDVDFIISDVRMPGKNGVEVVKSLIKIVWERYQRIVPYLFITGFADKQAEDDALKLKPLAYLMKPFDLKELTSAVSKGLEPRSKVIV